MGAFADFQPLYARHNIPTFPVLIGPDRKKPATMGYDRVGIPGSGQLALKFPEVDAFAFMAGRRTRLSVVDIDSTDEGLLRESEKRYGAAPIVARTSSGGFHLWYLHNGEERKIRPDPTVPVDILGGGVVIAPPSQGAKGPYEFIRGSLDDLGNLRPASNIILGPWEAPPRLAQSGRLITEGRNDALFRHLMAEARHLDDLGDLEDLARGFVDNLTDRKARHPFTDAEILATIRKVRDYTERGENRFGGKPHTVIYHDTLEALHDLGPDALYLYSILKKWSGAERVFPCANGLADHMPGGQWPLRRLQTARRALIEAGLIIQTREAATRQAALFAWP